MSLHLDLSDNPGIANQLCGFPPHAHSFISNLQRNVWIQQVFYDVNFNTFVGLALKIQRDGLLAKLAEEI